MPRGGPRKGAGRKKGVPDKEKRKALAIAVNYVVDKKLTPLEIFLSVMEQAWKANDVGTAMAAAKEAAPYIHPKLASTELKGDPNKPVMVPMINVSFGTPANAVPTYNPDRKSVNNTPGVPVLVSPPKA